jgi:hypothetical protein
VVYVSFGFLVLVSAFSQVGPGLVSILISFLFRIMCFRYMTSIWEKDFISIWILELGIRRS